MKSVEKGGVTVAHNLLLPLEGRAGRTATVGCKGTNQSTTFITMVLIQRYSKGSIRLLRQRYWGTHRPSLAPCARPIASWPPQNLSTELRSEKMAGKTRMHLRDFDARTA